MNVMTRTIKALVACGLVAAALPATGSANVQVGSSGWSWGNPLPQGNTLRAMAFSGTTGYAVGDFGTLLQTTDGGQSWTGLRAGTFSNLTELQVLDANTLFAGGGCVARRSVDGGKTFSRIAFTNVESSCPQDSTLSALAFVDQSFGYVFEASGQVFQTPDGGTRFATKIAVPGTKTSGGGATPTDATFTSQNVGFVATSDGKMYATTDGANSWKPVSDTNRPVRGITFVTPLIGYAVGDGSLFLKTSDGGATWVAKGVGGPAPQDLTGIRCATADVCVVTTRAGNDVIVTTDGGDAFKFPAPSSDPLYAAAFATATRLVAAGAQGSTTTSDDQGVNFTPIGGRLVGQFSRVRAGRVAGSAFAPGPDGVLGRTVDGGKTWTRGNVATSQDVLDVSFPTVNDGYALDVSGGVFNTNDGGQSWKTLDTGSTARANAVYAPSASVVMVIGPTGVRRSTDSGGSFDTVRGDAVVRTPLSDVDRAGSSAIVAWGPQDVILSADRGKTWRAVTKPGKYKTVKVKGKKKKVNRLGVRKVDFIDAKTGFLLDSSGRLWRTTNGGKKWSELAGVGTDGARGMSFSSARSGYLVVSTFGDVRTPTGFLLRTDDGGATWHPQFVESQVIPDGGVAGGGTDYLLGGQQALLSSTTGGDSGPASTLTIKAPKSTYSKPAHIVVTGKLSPASGNERVTVSYRRPGATRWTSQTVTASANGSFTSSWNVVKGANQFVAQWQGNFRSRGDGSKVLTVTVKKGKKK